MADGNLSLPESSSTLIIGTCAPESAQRLESVASGHGSGSEEVRVHSGRLSSKVDTRTQTYFIHAPTTERVKIGKSTRVVERFAALNCASSEWLVLLGILDGDRESEMHERFGRYRVKGEWFTLTGNLLHFVQTRFLKGRRDIQLPTYILDHKSFAGGVPGRVTVDYAFLSPETPEGRRTGGGA